MSKKLLLFGGLSAVSIATITPTGIHFHKRKERQEFISRSNVAVDKLNKDSTNINKGLSFLKDSDEDDKGKLIGILGVASHYVGTDSTHNNGTFSFSKEEMENNQKSYWEEVITKQQEEKGKGKSTKKTNKSS